MKKNINKYLLLTWLMIVVAILLIFYVPNGNRKYISGNASKLETWTLVKDNNRENTIELPEKIVEKEHGGIEIYTYLPQEFAAQRSVVFWSDCQDVHVYLENELIYTNVKEENRLGEAISSQWNYIKVPKDSAGKMFRICFKCPYNAKYHILDEIIYGSIREISEWSFKRYGINSLVDIILILIGILLIIYSLIPKKRKGGRISYFCLGLTTGLFGCWFRFGMKGVLFFELNPNLRAMFGYLAFFLLPIPLTIYIREKVRDNREFVKITTVLVTIECICVPVVLLLHALGIRDLQENIVVGWVLFTSLGIWMGVITTSHYLKSHEKNILFFVVNILLILIAVNTAWIQKVGLVKNLRGDSIARVCIILIAILECIRCFLIIYNKDEEQKRLMRENKNLQLQVLTGQIRPHFILNTLGAIRAMIQKDPEHASELLYDFSKYIRKNMEQKDYDKPIPFLEELDYIETYLRLEKLRFGDKLKVVYDIEEDEFWVLPLTIQPFVENALKHGLLPKKQGGTLGVSARKTTEGFEVRIQDDGVGFDVDRMWKELEVSKSVGIKSAVFRLEHYMNAKVKIESRRDDVKSGSCVIIMIPEKRSDER